MLLNEAVDRLYALKLRSRERYRETGRSHFELNARAYEAAVVVLTAALGEGAETEQDAERMLKDYPILRHRLQTLQGQFVTVDKPVLLANKKLACPACGGIVGSWGNYCHRCGKAIQSSKRKMEAKRV